MTTDTVHILSGGRVLCGFSPKVPGDWLAGNKWVGLDERELATCEVCVEQARIGRQELTGQRFEDLPDHLKLRAGDGPMGCTGGSLELTPGPIGKAAPVTGIVEALATALRIQSDSTNRSVACPCGVVFLSGAAARDDRGRPICIGCHDLVDTS